MFDRIKQALALAQLLAGLVPIIRQMVEAIEVPRNGVLKAEAVVAIVRALWDALPDDVRQLLGLDRVAAFTSLVITPIVAVLNAAGILSKRD